MAWEAFNQIDLNQNWQYTDDTDAEYFLFRHSILGAVARCLICQASIIENEYIHFQIREISANQNEVWHIPKPSIFTNRRLGFCQVYGPLNWNIKIDSFMPLGNIGSVSVSPNTFSTASNAKLDYAANTSIVALLANANRKYAIFVNNTASDVTLVLGGTPTGTPTVGGPATGVTAGSGIILIGKGAFYEITPTNTYTGVVSLIASSAGSLGVVES